MDWAFDWVWSSDRDGRNHRIILIDPIPELEWVMEINKVFIAFD